MAEGLRGLLPSLAVFAAVLLVVLAPGSQAFKAAGPAHSSALVLRVARGEAAWEKRVAVSGLTLQGNLPRLYLRGGGDEDVEAEEDGGEEEAKEGDQGEDEGEDGKIDDPDAGPMTITKAIKEVYQCLCTNGPLFAFTSSLSFVWVLTNGNALFHLAGALPCKDPQWSFQGDQGSVPGA